MDNNKNKKASKNIFIGCMSIFVIFVVLVVILVSCTMDKKEDVNYSKLNKENLESSIINATSEKTNYKKKRIINTEITKDNVVNIKLNSDESTSVKSTKESMLFDTNDVLKEIKKFKDIKKVNVWWYFTMVDKYGKKSDDAVLKIGMDRKTLDKIDFENFNPNNYKELSQSYWLHPGFNKK